MRAKSRISKTCFPPTAGVSLDPLDKEHTRKPQILHQGGIEVIAPYHPAFLPAKPIRGEKRRKRSAPEQKPGPEKMGQPAKPIIKTG
jgi:hypothetical protein